MARYQVPQFIDVEDKLFGAFTLKQFIYVGGGAGLGFLCIHFIPFFFVAIFPALIFVALGIALAFYKYNTKPFIDLIDSALAYASRPRLYVWHQKEKQGDDRTEISLENYRPTSSRPSGEVATVKGSRLGDLSWTIDVKKDDAVESQKGEIGT